jgi:hypothetical protein
MASGYQQDSNQLTQGFYRVQWSASTGTYPTADGNNNGAINPYNWDTYILKPTTTISANRLARGNLRWNAIIEQLALLSDCRIENVVVTSAGNTVADNQPTGVSFTVVYDRDAFVLPGLQKALTTSYNGSTATSTYTTTAQAIRDIVVGGFIRGTTVGEARTYRTYNPVGFDELQTSLSIQQPDVPANIFADVTVTQISGTTLV